MKYAASTVTDVMKHLPKNMKIDPIPPVMANKKAFLKIKKKDSLQAIQKLLLATAQLI